jgi:hypothetical protein
MREFEESGSEVTLREVSLQPFDQRPKPPSVVPLRLIPRFANFCLNGRGTTMVDVLRSLSPSEVGSPAGTGMVLKLSWTVMSRVSEIRRLREAHRLASDRSDILSCLPSPIFSVELSQYNTGIFRGHLRLTHAPERERSLWAIVFERLRPLQELKGQELLGAIADCVRCKCLLGPLRMSISLNL